MSYIMRVASLDHAPTMSSSKVAGDKHEQGCDGCCACEVSHEFLFWFASFVWAIGAFACLYRGYTLVDEAQDLGAPQETVLFAVVPCIVMGVVLGYFMFMKLAHRNIDRIEKLARPLWYNGFRWQFYCFLIGFDCTIFILTEYFSKTVNARLAWGSLDLSVGTSLTMSFFVYVNRWRSFYVMDRFPEIDSPDGGSMTKSLLYKYEDPPRLSDHSPRGSSFNGTNSNGSNGNGHNSNGPYTRGDSGSSQGSDPSNTLTPPFGTSPASSANGFFGSGKQSGSNASPSPDGYNVDGTVAGSLRGSDGGGLPRRGSGSGRDSFNLSGSMGTSPLLKIEEDRDAAAAATAGLGYLQHGQNDSNGYNGSNGFNDKVTSDRVDVRERGQGLGQGGEGGGEGGGSQA